MPDDPSKPQRPLASRLLWFVVLWLVGALVLVPLILAYTAWSYWVFRGKVGTAGGYH